ncbi:MAG: carboxypeptidase-like regulatory domain-containing protein [Planctomycetota bacterium]
MRRPGTWLLLSMLGMLLGFLGIRLASGHDAGPKPAISAQEWYTAHADLAASTTTEPAAEVPAARAVVRVAGEEVHPLVARFDRAGDGRPLAGVEVRLVPYGEGPDAARVAVTDDSGEVRFEDLPAGPYHLDATHPTMVPVRSNFLPTHRVVVPGVPATASFAGVWVACFEPVGDELVKYWETLEYHGFERGRVFPGHEFGDVHARLRARWGRNLLTFVPAKVEAADPRVDLRLFFRNKGIVPASVPLVPVESFVGPTLVDVRDLPDQEPAPVLEVRLRDARGRLWTPRSLQSRDPETHRITFMYQFATNDPVPVPPGSYTLCRATGCRCPGGLACAASS